MAFPQKGLIFLLLFYKEPFFSLFVVLYESNLSLDLFIICPQLALEEPFFLFFFALLCPLSPLGSLTLRNMALK